MCELTCSCGLGSAGREGSRGQGCHWWLHSHQEELSEARPWGQGHHGWARADEVVSVGSL